MPDLLVMLVFYGFCGVMLFVIAGYAFILVWEGVAALVRRVRR